MLAKHYADAKETLKEYFRNQITLLETEEVGISSEDVASYIKQNEEETIIAKQEKSAVESQSSLSENEETKINVKLKELMETTNAK